MSVDEIFVMLGGPAAVARAIEKTTEHACTMRRRRSIPIRYWPKLIEVAHSKGVEIDEALLTTAHLKLAS